MSTNRQIYQLIGAFFLLFSAFHVQALTLSDIELNSSLNQKLDAKITLRDVNPSDLDALTVIVLPFNKDVPGYRLRYELIHDTSGPYLRITSKNVIREPVLQFKLDINWSAGRIIREYSLLIDPVNNSF